MSTAKTAPQENEIAIKNLELDIGTRSETISRLKKQQYETRKNSEYQALGTEVVRYTGDVDALETEELELMEKADERRKVLAEAERALAFTKTGVDEEVAVLAKRTENFTDRKSVV